MNSDKPVEVAQSVAVPSAQAWSVVCLCAAWCGVCRQYEVDFRALQQQFPQVRFVWLDVEDEEELVGELDVETFPTLLIAHLDRPMFLGPLLPQIKVLERLLASLQEAQAASPGLPAEAAALWRRIAAQLA